jgi:hypothetical protein
MLLGIYFLNDSTGWSCGDGGNVYYTSTGGYTDVENENSTNLTQLDVYPNTASDILTIQNAGNNNIEIYSPEGQELLTYHNSDVIVQHIDISILEQGVYFIKVGEKIYKIVKI